jgi:hypothetical protein
MLTGVMEVDQAETLNLYKFTIRRGGNMMVFGPAGTGKTEMALQACSELEYEFKYLNLSVLEAPELMGLPRIDEATNKVKYALQEGFPLKGERKKPVILVADEVDKAKPELQNPMLELFQFRSINGMKLDFHAVIATGNLPDENAFAQPVSHALTNRCGVYRMKHAFEPWREWAANSGINPLIVGFLSRNTNFLLQPPADGDDTAYAHPSPRAWAEASKDLDETSLDDPIEFQELLVAGRCGVGAATKFKVWLEHYRFIEPMIDALVTKGTHPNNDLTIDRQIVCAIAGVDAIASKCRAEAKDAKAKDEQVKQVLQTAKNVTGWLKGLPVDHQVAAVKSVMTMEIIQKFGLTKVPEFMEVINKIRTAMK